MSATAPNSARKNQRNKRRPNRESSPSGSGSVGDNNDKTDSFASPTKVNNLARGQNNIPNQQACSIVGETTTQRHALSPLPPTAPLRSPTGDTKRDSALGSATQVIYSRFDGRDEESNGERSSAHFLGNVQNDYETSNHNALEVESISPIQIDVSIGSPLLQKPTSSIMKRNDSVSANIDDVNLFAPNNHYSRLHLSPKQDRCSPEMKKSILSLLEKGQQQQQVEEGGKTDKLEPQSSQPHHPSNDPSNDLERRDGKTLSCTPSTSLHQEPEVCKKRLETEESKASTLSVNDLLNLQQCCALSSTSSSSTNDNNSNGESKNSAKNDVAVDKEFRRSCSMEPMVEGEKDEQGPTRDKDEAAITHSSPAKGGCNDDADKNNTKSKSSSPFSSLQAQHQAKSSSSLVYRMYNDSPTSPMSEVNHTLMEAAAAAVQCSPCSSAGITPSLFQENDDDDIGGDTYFEEKISPRRQPYSSLSEENERRDGDNDYCGDGIDELMTPLPPPRVHRTKDNPMVKCSSTSSTNPTTSAAAASTNTTTTNTAQLAGAPSLPIRSPRRQETFTSHTHSLLDDCSDEEENDDNDYDEQLSSSYVMIDKQSSSRGISSWKKRSNNMIQIALLQTRHRRWEIQSALCGSHAQSNQIFDLSTRVHYIPNFHNRQHNFSFSPVRSSMTSDADIDDDGVAFLARLSVPIESIRAGALGSGLWRTVRLVKLPRGLFGWHWLMWKEQRQVPDSVYFGDNMPLGNEVWSLLQMLGETFPRLEQIDFGGDIAAKSLSREEESVDSADAYNKDEWRNEILTCIMQCLPKLVAVDGFAVEMEKGGEEDEPFKSDGIQESSVDGSFGEQHQHFIKHGQAHTGVGTRKDFRRSSSSFNIPNQCDVATETSDAIEDVSENIMSLCDNYMHAHSEEKSIPTDHYGPMIASVASEETKLAPASSPLASSFSWVSAESSSARPPTCPNSDTRRRLPSKPTIRSKMKSKLSKKNKRRLKKLTGLIPSMLDDDEDSDDDGSLEGEGAEECPADIL